ncbi:MAG: bile acid:sodium symporter [Candidatus Izemoplasma sp.]
MFFKFLELIKKNLLVTIFIGMGFGLIIGNNFDVDYFKNFIIPLTFLLVYPMMVTLKFHTLIEKSNKKLQFTTQLINFILFPAIALTLGFLFFNDDPYLQLGLLLIALLPTSGMTISWTVMAKGNINAAIKMVIIGLLLGGILAPIYITVFLGSEVDVDATGIFVQILLVVFAPLLLGFLTQKFLIKKYTKEVFHKSIKPRFPLFSTLGIVLMIFVAMSLRAEVLIDRPAILLEILAPLIIMYALFFAISVGAARLFFNRSNGIALVNGTLIRNLSLALAIVLSTFDRAGDAGLMIAIAYVLQVQIAAWNVKISKYIFKKE